MPNHPQKSHNNRVSRIIIEFSSNNIPHYLVIPNDAGLEDVQAIAIDGGFAQWVRVADGYTYPPGGGPETTPPTDAYVTTLCPCGMTRAQVEEQGGIVDFTALAQTPQTCYLVNDTWTCY
jgi:hypothetical protein